MQDYEKFWLENNKSEKKVAVIKIKRKPKSETSRRFVVVKKQDLIARGPATSAPVGSDITISFDPEITASPKWRSQFHYPDDGSSGYMVKEDDYKFNMEL